MKVQIGDYLVYDYNQNLTNKYLKKVLSGDPESYIDQTKVINLTKFKEFYLNPESNWIEDEPLDSKMQQIKNPNICKLQISEIITQLKYSDFLKTPYWKAISEFKKFKSNYKCEKCDEVKNLHCHHKTYKNHGHELDHLDDLEVVCKTCHQILHAGDL